MQNSNRIIAGRVLKVAIVSIAALLLFFALRRFFINEQSVSQFTTLAAAHWPWLVLVVLLLPLNWFLETAKWKRLIAASETISWKEAWSAVLAGLAIGAATPNRVGEFAGRIFQLRSTPLRDGIVFTLVSSFMQVLVTVAFGFIGLLLTDPDKYFHSTKAFVWIVLVTGAATLVIGFLKTARGKIADYFSALRKIDGTTKRDVFLLSALRYAVYTFQFLLMLNICGVEAPVFSMLCAIVVNYLVVTIIPSVIFSEMIVRGTVATGVIGGLCGNPGAAALAAVLLWMINVALPAAIGLFFVKNITFFKRK